MLKKVTTKQSLSQRKKPLVKTIKLNEVENVILPEISQVKTTKALSNRHVQIHPFLNLENLQKQKTQKNSMTPRNQQHDLPMGQLPPVQPSQDNSFTLQFITKKKTQSFPLVKESHTSDCRLPQLKNLENGEFENSVEKSTKRERQSCKSGRSRQYKILLSKRSSFPLYLKEKKERKKNFEQIQSKMFLDSSTISNISLLNEEQGFISEKSFAELSIL